MASLSIRVDLDGDGRLGPGKVLLLERIAEPGSISADSMSVGIPFGGNLQFRTMRRSRFVTQAMKSASERGSGGASLNLSRI